MKKGSCLLCKSTHLTTALKLNPTPMADDYVTKRFVHTPQPSYPLALMLCRNCGHVQLQDIISPKSIYPKYIYQTANSPGLINHFHAAAGDVVASIKPPKNSLVVDIGSNDGTLLKEYKKFGMKVLGIDPAKQIAHMATRAGTETLPEFFTPKLARLIRKKYGQATIVTANNIFANVDNLDEFVKGIKKLLSPDGIFVFESFYLKDLIQNKVFDFVFHEHISYFSIKPLVTFFRKHNMEIIDAKHLSTKGGSIRYTVQQVGGPRKVSTPLSDLTSAETRIGLQNIAILKSFEKSIVRSKRDLWNLLRRINKQKKLIAGYGASASCTTLMYHFDLIDTLSFLIDENPIKLNTYSPGRHLLVVPPEEIYMQKPDYILILAWRFARQIIDTNKKFLKRGGHFIIPLPTLRVV